LLASQRGATGLWEKRKNPRGHRQEGGKKGKERFPGGGGERHGESRGKYARIRNLRGGGGTWFVSFLKKKKGKGKKKRSATVTVLGKKKREGHQKARSRNIKKGKKDWDKKVATEKVEDLEISLTKRKKGEEKTQFDARLLWGGVKQAHAFLNVL